MEFSAEQIAGILNGEIQGNPKVIVNDLSKIEDGKAGTLSFLSNPKYEEYIYQTEASICIVNKTFTPQKSMPSDLTLIKVDDAYACFGKLLELYNQMYQKEVGIEEPSFVSDEAKIGKNCHVGAFSYISKNAIIEDNVTIYPNTYVGENVIIKSGTKIYPNVTVYHDCKIGKNCIIHSGAVIGSDGFGFAPNEKGEFQKIPQIGNVLIEDNVEIGSNVSIDRATMGSTFIRTGVKIDNLCQIAHNVDVDENSAMAAQVGIAGSSKIGKNVLIGGQAGISGHLKIADQTKIVAQSGIPSTVKKAQTLMGTPGIPIDDFKKSYFGFRKLPYLLKKVQELEQRIETLTK
ncbi:MAG: UDP-3-O-(3-hydroxymyristoyl)glucosamine N-acyltransferase [Bacteroidota bacterium]|nr:UDP-3-O-(3-hydroxymyristoyl)glucosamine N-acyltransferase [Bacteroidota bacterium]